MKTIMFNSIQVTNYWFTLHRTLKPLYQQAQTSSPNIQGISDQDVTLRSFCVQLISLVLTEYGHNMYKCIEVIFIYNDDTEQI